MRVFIFILIIINLLFVPTKACTLSGFCADLGKYYFLFNIPAGSIINWGKLLIQLIILGLLFGATYSKHYDNLVSKIKNNLKLIFVRY